MSNSEQALRQEAIRRRLAGESRKVICVALNHATSWFDKWWSEYKDNPGTDFADRSRAPHIAAASVGGNRTTDCVGARAVEHAAQHGYTVRVYRQPGHHSEHAWAATRRDSESFDGATGVGACWVDATDWCRSSECLLSVVECLRGQRCVCDRFDHALSAQQRRGGALSYDRSLQPCGLRVASPEQNGADSVRIYPENMGFSWPAVVASVRQRECLLWRARRAGTRASLAKWCACVCSVASSPSSLPSTIPNATTKSRTSTACG